MLTRSENSDWELAIKSQVLCEMLGVALLSHVFDGSCGRRPQQRAKCKAKEKENISKFTGPGTLVKADSLN